MAAIATPAIRPGESPALDSVPPLGGNTACGLGNRAHTPLLQYWEPHSAFCVHADPMTYVAPTQVPLAPQLGQVAELAHDSVQEHAE